jgi:hypothetical protein
MKKFLISLILTACFSFPASGQENTEVSQIKSQIKILEDALNQLKARVAKLEGNTAGPGTVAVVRTQPAAVITENKKETPSKLIFSGKAYFGYMDGFRAESPGGFDLYRGYFGGAYQISSKLSFKFTTDMAARRMDGTGPFSIVLKKMFLDYQFSPNHRLMVGQIDLPWVVNCEDVQGFRFIGKCFSEEEGYYSSADLGVGLKGQFKSGVVKYHLDLVNGTNWTAPEADRSKDVHVLVTLTPFARFASWQKGLFLSVGGSSKTYNQRQLVAGERADGYRADAMLGYDNPTITATFETLLTDDPGSRAGKFQPSVMKLGQANGFGYSAFVHYRPNFVEGRRLGVLARFDSFDPDRNKSALNAHRRMIAGPSWRLSNNLQFWTGYWGVRFQEAAQVKIRNQNYLGFFAEAKF